MAIKTFKPLQSTRIAEGSSVDFQIALSKAVSIITIGE
jgi:hypothetical protein